MFRIVIAALALAGAAAPACAQLAASDSASVAVRTADLDLTSEGGIAMLDRRLATAIDQVCGKGDIRNLRAMLAERRCRTEARTQVTLRRDAVLAAAAGRASGRVAAR